MVGGGAASGAGAGRGGLELEAGGAAAMPSTAEAPPTAATTSYASGFQPFALACSLLIAMIIYFPLREPRIEYLASIWWVRVAFLVLLTLVACSASPSGAVWIILAAALLGVVYVLAMNVHATRHLPLATDSADGPHHTTPGTPNAPSRTPTDIRPVAQIAQIRHQQYADLIQRCLHAKQRDAPVCQQLATLHRTVHDLHSQEDVLPTKERDQDAFSDRPESS